MAWVGLIVMSYGLRAKRRSDIVALWSLDGEWSEGDDAMGIRIVVRSSVVRSGQVEFGGPWIGLVLR